MGLGLMSRRRSKVDNTQLAIGLGLIAIMLAIIGWNLPLLPTSICVSQFTCENGSGTITIPANSVSGTTTISFSPVFLSPPKVILSLKSFGANVVSPSVTDTVVTYRGTPLTWTVPVADSDIFNDKNYRFGSPQVTNGVTQAQIVANINASFTGGSGAAFLGLQYSNDGGTTWNDWIIASSANGLDLGSVNTPGIVFSGNVIAPVSPVITQSITIMRIHGLDTSGLGTDSVSINSIQVIFTGSLIQGLAEVVCITPTTSACTITGRTNGKSSTTQTLNFNWLAYV